MAAATTPVSTQLLEREGSLERLQAAVDATEAGSGRIVLVAGEAGVGKTALLRAFVERVRGSSRVLQGSCDALFTPRPLGPFLQMGEDVAPLRATLARDGRPHDVVTALLGDLTAGWPTIVVLEDVHCLSHGW